MLTLPNQSDSDTASHCKSMVLNVFTEFGNVIALLSFCPTIRYKVAVGPTQDKQCAIERRNYLDDW